VNTLDELRARYGRFSDRELQLLLTAEGGGLTAEARQALGEEAARRGITATAVVPPPSVPTRIDGKWHYLLVNQDGRRVGDMVAGTQVIDAKLYDPNAPAP
jgi:uncharacterized RDD family membrane protein YckC